MKPAPRRQEQHRRGEDRDRPEEPQRQEALPMALDEVVAVAFSHAPRPGRRV